MNIHKCTACKGTGEIEMYDDMFGCEACGGSGEIVMPVDKAYEQWLVLLEYFGGQIEVSSRETIARAGIRMVQFIHGDSHSAPHLKVTFDWYAELRTEGWTYQATPQPWVISLDLATLTESRGRWLVYSPFLGEMVQFIASGSPKIIDPRTILGVVNG